MTRSQRNRTTLLVAAAGTLLPIGAANASTLNILGNKFVEPMAGAGVDVSMYDHIYILGSSIPTARQGAEGPVRTETMPEHSMSGKGDYDAKLHILGNTFWRPGKEQ